MESGVTADTGQGSGPRSNVSSKLKAREYKMNLPLVKSSLVQPGMETHLDVSQGEKSLETEFSISTSTLC